MVKKRGKIRKDVCINLPSLLDFQLGKKEIRNARGLWISGKIEERRQCRDGTLPSLNNITTTG